MRDGAGGAAGQGGAELNNGAGYWATAEGGVRAHGDDGGGGGCKRRPRAWRRRRRGGGKQRPRASRRRQRSAAGRATATDGGGAAPDLVRLSISTLTPPSLSTVR